jgi:hypothetical protein
MIGAVIFAAASLVIVAFVAGFALGHSGGLKDRGSLSSITPPRLWSPEDRVLSAGVVETKYIEVPVREPVINYDRMRLVTLYRVGRAEPSAERRNAPGWDKIYRYYWTAEQAHDENVFANVAKEKAIEIDGHLYGSRFLENIEPLTVQAKPKRKR